MTTLYNHKRIGEKPVIPNAEFKRICEELEKGNNTPAEQAMLIYSLESTQLRIIKQLQNDYQ